MDLSNRPKWRISKTCHPQKAKCMASCGQHGGPCLTEETSEGVFCTVSGYELHPPAAVCHDFRQCCNPLSARLPASSKKHRKANALRRHSRRLLGAEAWRGALRTLYGAALSADEVAAWAASISKWSSELQIHKQTAPAMRQWALLFTATVTSKIEKGKMGSQGTVVPKCNTFAACAIPHTQYKHYGISCRLMSLTWRKIIHAAMTDAGVVVKPFTPPKTVSDVFGDGRPPVQQIAPPVHV